MQQLLLNWLLSTLSLLIVTHVVQCAGTSSLVQEQRKCNMKSGLKHFQTAEW